MFNDAAGHCHPRSPQMQLHFLAGRLSNATVFGVDGVALLSVCRAFSKVRRTVLAIETD